ncbi:hypothetical protein GOODEAATRI_027520 [Goodea atripinnis]|uniref:Uncharacterized protein n=2 Tax=Goodeidae TaxID=28758 RepID=A0ABU7CMW0_9TELE|nr:hypothetical protein [Ataeniobius toweri]
MNNLNKSQDFDSYEIDEPSDEERAESSSEDELDVLLNGTPEQKKKLIREYLTGESESSSEDEFEKEMEAELSSTIRTMEGTWAPADGNLILNYHCKSFCILIFLVNHSLVVVFMFAVEMINIHFIAGLNVKS